MVDNSNFRNKVMEICKIVVILDKKDIEIYNLLC